MAPKSKTSNGSSEKASLARSLNGVKKMGSLSSFQSTLNFSAFPVAPIRPSATRSSNSVEDAKRMPPPGPGIQGKRTVSSTSKSSSSSSASRSTTSSVKGKGREEDPVILIDSDEEEGAPSSSTQGSSSRYNMWSERYAPVTEAELAPGNARIAKVKNWMHEALHGHPQDYTGPPGGMTQTSKDRIRKYRRMLLLTGPAGAGKATTVRVLAKEMGIDLVEWGEGVEERTIGVGIERESAMSKLSSFLSRNSYRPLEMSMSDPGSSSQSSSQSSRPRILLLTALPNISHLPTREAFHSMLSQFCQNYSSTSCPLIVIHSEAGSGGRAEESWMDRERGGREGALELLGKEVKDGPWCQELSFPPIAPTFLTKALTRVLDMAILKPQTPPPRSAVQLIAMTANGDLRSAINSLQLLCAGGLKGTSNKRKRKEEVATGKKKGLGSRGGKGAKLDVSEDLRAVLDAVTRREQSLNLFHALGKVFYNKRLGDPKMEDEDAERVAVVEALPDADPLPSHLASFERRKSMVQMENYLPTIPVDASSFSLWIQQSLPSFCSDIDQVSFAFDDLCSADVMRTDEDFWQASPQAIAYALHISVRGSLMALPSPVPRKNQKVIKPQFFEAYRDERSNTTLLDTAAGYLAKRGVNHSVHLAERDLNAKEDDGYNAWGGVATKLTMATELLPMMVKIQGLSGRTLLPSSLKPLSMPPYNAYTGRRGDELRDGDEQEEQGMEHESAGEDGLGLVDNEGWDETDQMAEEEGDVSEEEDIGDF